MTLDNKFDPKYCKERFEGKGLARKIFNLFIKNIKIENREFLSNLNCRKVYVSPHWSHLDEAVLLVAIYNSSNNIEMGPRIIAKKTYLYDLVNIFGFLDKFGAIAVKDNKNPVKMKRLAKNILNNSDLLFFPNYSRDFDGIINLKPLIFSSILEYALNNDVYVCPVNINYEPRYVEEPIMPYLDYINELMVNDKLNKKIGGIGKLVLDLSCYFSAPLRGKIEANVCFKKPINAREFLYEDLGKGARMLAKRAQDYVLS